MNEPLSKPILLPWLASSTDPTQVSAKVQGIVLALSSTLIFVAQHIFRISLGANDIVSLASGIGMTAGAIWFVFGLLRHGVVSLGSVSH